MVSWPSADTASFTLEQAGTLAGPATWVTNTASVTDDGTNKSATLPATNSSQFFRFRKSSGEVVTNCLEVSAGDTANLNLAGPNQIGNNATILITAGSQLYLNGGSATIGNLILSNYSADASASLLDTGTGGLLGINGSVTSWNDNDTVIPTINGRLTLNGFTPFFVGGSAYAGLDLPAALGANGFSKAGNGALILRGTSSTYTGNVEVDQGILDVQTSGAFGASTGGVLLYGSGSMILRSSVAGETVTAQGLQQITIETGGSLLTASASTNVTWSGPIVLNTNLVVLGTDITLSGVISGPGGLDFRNTGTAILGGTTANTFSGATLARGALLELGKPSNVRALNGPLSVGNSGGSTCEVRWLNNYQDYYNLNYTTPSFTLYPNAFINVNNNIEIFGPITFNGGLLDSGPSGLAVVAQPVTVNPTNVSAVINGLLGLQGGTTALFIVGDGPPACDLIVNAVIQGTPNYFHKQGPGTMCLYGGNTYDAVTLLEEGMLDVYNSSALGSTAGTVISSGATLRLNGSGTMSEPFEMVGTGLGGTNGALAIASLGSWNLNGDILLDAATTINLQAGAGLNLNGVISGTGPLIKTGPAPCK